MDYPLRKCHVRYEFPQLAEIPDAPEEVWMRGNGIPRGTSCLAVVGSRNYSNYGKQVVEHLISGLRSFPIAIISGLAIGIDSLAHKAALENGLYTLAVPGSGLNDDILYPSQNRSLARRILESGGGLLSEFAPDLHANTWTFPQRNRIMAGLSHATLLIEAAEKSGTLITARLTVDYNRELLVVPGNIFSENSRGVHQFLKLGATPVTSPHDILIALGIDVEEKAEHAPFLTEEERRVLTLLSEPRDSDSIIRLLSGPPEATLMLLMRMELSGHIREQNGLFYKL